MTEIRRQGWALLALGCLVVAVAAAGLVSVGVVLACVATLVGVPVCIGSATVDAQLGAAAAAAKEADAHFRRRLEAWTKIRQFTEAAELTACERLQAAQWLADGCTGKRLRLEAPGLERLVEQMADAASTTRARMRYANNPARGRGGVL